MLFMLFDLIDYIQTYKKDFVILNNHTHYIEIIVKNNSYQKTVQKNLKRITDRVVDGFPIMLAIDGESEMLSICDANNKNYYIPIDTFEVEYSFIKLLCE
jgi:hypothetical protein